MRTVFVNRWSVVQDSWMSQEFLFVTLGLIMGHQYHGCQVIRGSVQKLSCD